MARLTTREFVPPRELTVTPDSQTWGWVAKSLCSKERKTHINLIDTVVPENDTVTTWLFTSARSGAVMKKGEKHLTRDKVKAAFNRFSSAYAANIKNYACVMHNKNSSRLLTSDELNTAMLAPLDCVALSPYAHPRGNGPGWANFRHEYSIYAGSMDTVPVNNTFKYCEGLPGQGMTSVRSKDSRVNETLEDMVVNVVRTVEAARRVRVTKMVAQFCVDDQNVPWFMATTECLTVSPPKRAKKQTAAASDDEDEDIGTAAGPSMFPANRRAGSPPAKGRPADTRPDSADVGPRHLMQRKGSEKGKAVTLKTQREDELLAALEGRRSSSASSVSSPGGAGAGAGAKRRARRRGGKRRPFGAIPSAPTKLDVDEDNLMAFQAGTPAETLGSTQRTGCSGDFCSVVLVPKKVQARTGGDGQRRAWTIEEARRGATGAAEADEDDVSHPAPLSGRNYSVSYRDIAQARQEAYYVQLMLKRHRQGQKGEFISADYYPEATTEIAMSFPAQFYREVQVCGNCHRVYAKIKTERAQSLARRKRNIERAAREAKAEEEGGGSSEGAGNGSGAGTASGTARMRSSKRSGTSSSGKYGRTTTPFQSLLSTSKSENNFGFTASRQGLDPDDADAQRLEGARRAAEALQSLTMSEFVEMRTFVSPPPAVALVGTALMLLLTGDALEWPEVRRILMRGDRLMTMIQGLDMDAVPPRRIRQLLPIVRKDAFQPEDILFVCRSAAKLASWVLGVVQYAAGGLRVQVQSGSDARPLSAPGVAGSSSTPTLPPLSASRNGSQRAVSASSAGFSNTAGGRMNMNSSADSSSMDMSFAEKLQKRRQQEAKRASKRAGGANGMSSSGSRSAKSSTKRSSSSKRAGTRGSARGSTRGSSNGGGSGLSGTGPARSSSKRQNAAARRAQEFHTKRLVAGGKVADPTGPQSFADAPNAPQGPDLESRPKLFTCADGVTSIPYQVIGQPDRLATTVNFVVLLDLFDTFESMQVLLADFMKTTRAQFLLLNVPGQAFSTFPSADTPPALNNEFIAARLLELLQNADMTKEFNTTSQSFHLMGIGNGGNIAACFGCRYGHQYPQSLKSLVLVNGFAAVDKQLSSILHSSINVFSVFPESRPDLPVSYFTRFLFSEAYIGRVTLDLALSMYTAITNPIKLQGRIRLCQGALMHTDLRRLLPGVPVPVVVMQATEDVLVSPSNVDDLVEGRAARHIWSHEQDPVTASWFGPRSVKHLRESLSRRDGAFVVWLKCGHEIRMEARQQFLRLIQSLADPDAALAEAEALVRGEPAGAQPGVLAPTRIPAPPQFGMPDFHQPGGAGGAAGADAAAPTSSKRKYTRQRREKLRKQREEKEAAERSSGSRRTTPAASLRPESRDEGDDYGDSKGAEAESEPEPEPEQAPPSAEEIRAKHLADADREFEEAMRRHQETKMKRGAAKPSRAAANKEPPSSPMAVEKPMDAPTAAAAVPDGPEPPREATPPTPRTAAAQILVASQRNRLPGTNLESEYQIAERRKKEEAEMEARLEMLRREQEARRQKWEQEDAQRMALYTSTVDTQQSQMLAESAMLREATEAQSRNLLLESTKQPEEREHTYVTGRNVDPVLEQRPQYTDLHEMFGQLEAEEKMEAEKHNMKLEDYEKVKGEMAEAQRELAAQQMEAQMASRREEAEKSIKELQRIARGFLGRVRFKQYKEHKEEFDYREMMARKLQAVGRGYNGRKIARERKQFMKMEETKGGAIRNVQRVIRGFLDRRYVARLREEQAAINAQRVYRGHLGRRYYAMRRAAADRAEVERVAATKLQATWRMKMQFEEYRELQILQLAAMQVQRVWRGWLGRRRATRKRDWQKAAPGPERLALGLELIEGSKEAFERQRQEIDALHRAQERAEARVSEIHAGLQEREEELSVIERELRGIDQLDADLRELAHDKRIVDQQVAQDEEEAAEEAAANGTGGRRKLAKAKNAAAEEAARKRAAEAHALEVAIHMKKAEREKKKLELEAEFAGVYGEIEKKKGELRSLEGNIVNMEAMRQRKDREFQRLQRNLTELLGEQKSELDSLRQKGVELETATATSAAAAAATAAQAKEAEKRTQAMFQSTEELLKFQFMSMSLSYFSSLNMLGNLRDINADTTSSAIRSTADAAAASAAAAAAANIPSLKAMNMGAGELLDAASMRRKMDEAEKVKAIEDAKKALAQPFDEDVTRWNIRDVCRWLQTLSLGQYRRAFEEAAVDGEFLLELRSEDLEDVLGVEHKLHVKKILAARDKLRPLSKDEQEQKQHVESERKAAAARGEVLVDATGVAHEEKAEVPDTETVFSMVRHNRIKRLRAALDAGFNIASEDAQGNTLLLVAAQNVNKKAMEMAVEHGCNINHQNKGGNTALHFAMAYDPDGTLGEYLIDKGANDMLENKQGLSAYDGLSLDA